MFAPGTAALASCLFVGLLASVPAAAAPRGTTIAVTIGKPSELAFTLSKQASIPAGPVTFKVTNKGAGTHNFEICLTPAKNANANKCAGKAKATPSLASGKTASITVTMTKGLYEFLCSLTGHPAEGMKGLLGVGITVTTPPTTTPSTSTSAGNGCPAGQTLVTTVSDDGHGTTVFVCQAP